MTDWWQNYYLSNINPIKILVLLYYISLFLPYFMSELASILSQLNPEMDSWLGLVHSTRQMISINGNYIE